MPKATAHSFLFVLDGAIDVHAGAVQRALAADDFAYFPPDTAHRFTPMSCFCSCAAALTRRRACCCSLSSAAPATALMYEQRYIPPTGVAATLAQSNRPQVQVGSTDAQPLIPCDGEVFGLRKLLPATPEYDFNMHVMTFEPGEFLTVKEVHFNQHGLLLLEGQGVYRLGDKWCVAHCGVFLCRGGA